MVLSDNDMSTSSLSSDFADDSSPSSTDDPVEVGETRPLQLQIDMNSLPRPMPVFGPLFGFTRERVIASIRQRIEIVGRVIGRSVTQDEGTAMAYYTAKALALSSYGPPIGAAAGLARAYASMDSYRFPFYTPDPKSFDRNRLLFLNGRSAQLGWHALRGMAYGFLGGYTGRYLALAYAASVAVVNESRDPRLKDISKALQEYARKRASGPLIPPGETRPQHGRTQQGQIPTAGFDDPDDSTALMQTQDGIQSDQEAQEREMHQQPASGRQAASARSPTFETEKIASQPRGFDDELYGEVSPEPTSGESTDSRSGRSAWDRLRRNATVSNSTTPGAPPRPQGSPPKRSAWPQRQGSGPGGIAASEDGFAYSSSEEDRQLAKNEAQRFFDEQVERERRGGDFGRGGG